MKARIRDWLARAGLSLVILLGPCGQAAAEWETGAKGGYDSNVDRAIDGGNGDSYLSAYLSFFKEPRGESRTDWTLAATLEGSLYARYHDLDYLLLTVAPGINIIPHRNWTIQIFPFIQLKGVKDSEQSSWTLGGKVSLTEQLTKDLYVGQYYVYRNSDAESEVYSFTENGLGIFLGLNWTSTIFSEIGYEYSRGDSFQAVSTTSSAIPTGPGRGKQLTHSTRMGPGMGNQRIYSTAFGSEIIKEKVDRHSIGISAGIDWTKSLFSLVSYSYTTIAGDLGTSIIHAGFIGLGYRF